LEYVDEDNVHIGHLRNESKDTPILFPERFFISMNTSSVDLGSQSVLCDFRQVTEASEAMNIAPNSQSAKTY